MIDASYLTRLKHLVEQHRSRTATIVSRWHPDLLKWIISQTPELDVLANATTATRIYWLLNGIHEFPKCKTCGKPMVSNVKSVLDGYVQSHCSVSCASADPVVQEKKAATCIQHFGTDSYFKNEKAKQQIQATLIQKYGATHPMASAICRQKYEATNMKKYGTKWHIASKTVKEKSAQKNIAKLGVDNPWKCKAVQDKCRQRYRYDGQTFDSAPEIAFYIWLTDHHISFEYQPDVKLEYEHAGKKHFYVPDFKVGDRLIELKGDHFFKDGKMINPFRKSEWTDEQYADSCALYEAKHQCMLQNDVEVMTSDGYQKYLDYVAGKYGQNYLLQFKLNKQLDEQDLKHEQKKQPCCPE